MAKFRITPEARTEAIKRLTEHEEARKTLIEQTELNPEFWASAGKVALSQVVVTGNLVVGEAFTRMALLTLVAVEVQLELNEQAAKV